jgi:hypothetical protein
VTVNGTGFRLYGNTGYDEETKSYVATYYFVFLFIPILPIARYRVIRTDRNLYRFLGKLPLRTLHRWHLGIAAALLATLAALIAMGAVSIPGTDSTRSSELSSLKSQIDSDRSELKRLDVTLKPVLDRLKFLQRELNQLKRDLDAQRDRKQEGIPIDVEIYKTRARDYNELRTEYNGLVEANRADLKRYQALEREDSRLVELYNARVR